MFISALLSVSLSAVSCCNYSQLMEINEHNEIVNYSSNNNDSINSLIDSNSIQSCATITILTHGMGGTFVDFLHKPNPNENYYNVVDDSIVDVINTEYRIDAITENPISPQHNIYVSTGNNSYLKRLTASNGNNFSLVNVGLDSVDISNPITIIYNGDMSSRSNEKVTSDFENAINPIIFAVADKQGGILPKINLIGHSRGGLVNMEYAIKYYQIVQNFITIGSPLCSSPYAAIYANYLREQYEGEETNYDEMLSMNYCASLANRFNSISSNFYSATYGFAQTIEYLGQSLNSLGDFGQISVFFESQLGSWILTNIIDLMFQLHQINAKLRSDVFNTIRRMSSISFSETNVLYLIADIIILLLDDYDTYLLENCYKSDICVNIDSALGNYKNIYYNFNEHIFKCFGHTVSDDVFDAVHAAEPDMPFVAHNFETKYRSVALSIGTIFNNHLGFHKHNFQRSFDDDEHFMICGCGAKYNKNSHNKVYNYIDESMHSIDCSSNNCEYSSVDYHTFEYSLTQSGHNKTCIECEYSVNENHTYNVYVSNGINNHSIYCICGQYFASQKHSYLAGSLKCRYCGQINGISPGGGPIIQL